MVREATTVLDDRLKKPWGISGHLCCRRLEGRTATRLRPLARGSTANMEDAENGWVEKIATSAAEGQ